MKSKARILLYDVETAPNLGWIWGKYEQDVIEYVKQTKMLCFSWKWLDEKTTHVVALPDFEKTYKKDPDDDFMVMSKLWLLFNEADVVIAHNGDRFDQKVSNARFMEHGFEPPSPYRTIDTLKTARRYFKFNSNKLDDLGSFLKVGHKLQTGGFSLWRGCIQGDMKSWNTMKRYNKQDVVLLEKVYLKLRPWMDNHPALNVLDGRPEACPKCLGGPLVKRGTIKVNKTTTVQRYACTNCGGWSQSRKSEKSDVLYVN